MSTDNKIVKGSSSGRKKKLLIIIPIAIVLIGIIIFVAVKRMSKSDDKTKVYVASVSEAMGYGSVGAADRFTGVVDSQKAVVVKADSSKTIKTCFVNEGDQVTAGTQLFEYDTNEINNSIEETQLEIDKLNIEVTSAKQQITQLESEKAAAPSEEQLNYTMQIQSLTSDITSNQYDIKTKQTELDKLKASLNNAVVTSTVDGIIKSIGDVSQGDDDGTTGNSTETGYISILPLGNYQIKGIVGELGMGEISEGASVIITTRIDSSKTVKGTVSSIDYNNPISSSDSSMDSEDGEGTPGQSASKWYFYVTFENTENLVLGQHVFIEPDYGQDATKDGMWLSEFYLASNDDGSYYVWKEKDGKIVKQDVELGEYDSDTMTYEILKGLSESDYIAYPSSTIKEGQTTSHSIEDFNVDDIDDSDDSNIDNGDIDSSDMNGEDTEGLDENVDDISDEDVSDVAGDESASEETSAASDNTEEVTE